jgi:hypothetical protein
MSGQQKLTAADMPPVTDAHRLAAFERMGWKGWTYEAAMAFDMRRRLIECRAHLLRKQEWERTTKRTVERVKRVRMGADGHPVSWCTQVVMGPRVALVQPDLLTTEDSNP